MEKSVAVGWDENFSCLANAGKFAWTCNETCYVPLRLIEDWSTPVACCRPGIASRFSRCFRAVPFCTSPLWEGPLHSCKSRRMNVNERRKLHRYFAIKPWHSNISWQIKKLTKTDDKLFYWTRLENRNRSRPLIGNGNLPLMNCSDVQDSRGKKMRERNFSAISDIDLSSRACFIIPRAGKIPLMPSSISRASALYSHTARNAWKPVPAFSYARVLNTSTQVIGNPQETVTGDTAANSERGAILFFAGNEYFVMSKFVPTFLGCRLTNPLEFFGSDCLWNEEVRCTNDFQM